MRLKPEWIDAWLERHALDTQDRGAAGGTSSTDTLRPEATS